MIVKDIRVFLRIFIFSLTYIYQLGIIIIVGGAMRKYFLFIIMLLVPVLVEAKEEVYIESIELYKNNHVEEVSKATSSDLSINLDLKFIKVNSYITYKMVINNNEKEDYQIDDEPYVTDSDNIEYKYSCDNNNIVKSKSKNTCYVTVTYIKAPLIKNVFGTTYKEDSVIPLKLSQSIENPKTSDNVYLIAIVLLISIFIISAFVIKNKKARVLLFCLFFSAPLIIRALSEIKININSKIEIVDNGVLCSHEINNIKDYTMCLISEDLPLSGKYFAENYIDYLQTLMKENEKTECEDDECRQNKEAEKKEFDKAIEFLNSIKDLDDESLFDLYDKYSNDSSSEDDMNFYMFESVYGLSIESKVLAKNIYWDTLFDNEPTKDTYKNYPEGIYVENQRFIPIIRELNDNNLRGYSFTKLNTNDVEKVTSYSDLVKVEKNNNKIAFNISGGFTATKKVERYDDLESIDVDGNLTFYLEKDENDNVIVKELEANPESLSHTLFHRKNGLINALLDVMVNQYRLKNRYKNSHGLDVVETEHENLVEHLFSSYYQLINLLTDIRRRGVKLTDADKMDYKELEYLNILNFDFKGEKIKDDFYKKFEESGENYTTEEYNEMMKKYYEYYGLSYHVNSSGEYENDEIEFDMSRLNIVYNNKFYVGEDGFFKFIADHLNIDYSNSKDIKKTIYDALS